jgi:alpha-L-fucosidase
MQRHESTRREAVRALGGGLAAAAVSVVSGPGPATAATSTAIAGPATGDAPPAVPQAAEQAAETDRARRLGWWHAARFGMFVHWGLHSVLGRHEWAMENEAIPVEEYELLARRFQPRPGAAREWAQLARRAGMKYMVLTAKHHEGFCLFDTATTDYCAPRQAAGRDLVREYVDAARAEGLRVGFYYSLMDWHHPDGARCERDESARRRLVDYAHAQLRELLTNYGRIDVLWYDVAWPLDAVGWESEKMNEMVFRLQPDIVVNNRNKLPGDFATPEQRIEPGTDGRAWEACMTMNASWGYQAADDDWKTPRQILRNLISCSRDGGNYLLNIGPRADGSVPEQSVRILSEVGRWMERNAESVRTTDRCQPRRSNYASFTRRGHTLYMHVHFWPGDTLSIAGLLARVKAARLLATGQPVAFQQEALRVQFTGLPQTAPDEPLTTLAIDCDAEPRQDQYVVRRERRRGDAA